MMLLVFFKTGPGISGYVPADPNPFLAFTLLLQIVIGFFATAGAAGADFGMNSRNANDVRMGRARRHRRCHRLRRRIAPALCRRRARCSIRACRVIATTP